MKLTSQQASLLLCKLPKIGPITAKKLVDAFPSPQNIFQATEKQLLTIEGIGMTHINTIKAGLKQLKTIFEEEIKGTQNQQTLIRYGNASFPTTLSDIADPPMVFFQQGKIDWNHRRIISIVGTRNPSPQGVALCRKLIKELVPYNPLIISGFARGIDIVAHRTAVDNGLPTVAVLAHAFGHYYPEEHTQDVHPILNGGGGFLSEFWSNDPFERHNFLQRNRIIAGLAHLTVVIESGEKGGSLVTAQQAISYGREVFAFPGRIEDRQSKGCLNLIARDQARLLIDANQLTQWMGWGNSAPKKKTLQHQLFVTLSPSEKEVLHALTHPKHLDQLAEELNRPQYEIAAELLQMEMKNLIRSLPAKRFERLGNME